jgi:hypothetical protein
MEEQMSANVAVLFGHQLTPSALLSLPQELRSDRAQTVDAALRSLDASLGTHGSGADWGRPWRMSVLRAVGEEVMDPQLVWDEGRMILLRHPTGHLDLVIGRQACLSIPGVPWSVFLESLQLRIKLQALYDALAGILSSKVVVFLPNQFQISKALDLVYEGQSIDDILLWLKVSHGKPVHVSSGDSFDSANSESIYFVTKR